jgi:hypothetical protein
MSVEIAIQHGRAAAEALMVDACTIKHPTGETTGAGGVITATTSTLYTGRCRVQFKPMQGAGTDVGEAHLLLVRREVQLPMTVVGLREGDRITITASALDPDLVGKVYVVRDIEAKTHLTSRRVTVLEVTS